MMSVYIVDCVTMDRTNYLASAFSPKRAEAFDFLHIDNTHAVVHFENLSLLVGHKTMYTKNISVGSQFHNDWNSVCLNKLYTGVHMSALLVYLNK